MMSILRNDPRQWLIYERKSVTSVVKALEILALGIVGKSLASHPSLQVRGLANLMSRVSDARLRTMLGLVGDVPDEDRASAEGVVKILAWLSGEIKEPPVEILDEFHAAAFWIDHRAGMSGITGGGWERELIRGEHGR